MHQRQLLYLAALVLVPSLASAQGTPLGPEFRVNPFIPGNQHGPKIAADSAGNFVVAWEGDQYPLVDHDVMARRYAGSGDPLTGEFRVNSSTTSDQYLGGVASDPHGNFVVVWSAVDGSSFDVFGQRYASSGAPIGAEFRVNTSTTEPQGGASVAADPVGNFVVVWARQIGSSLDILAQRFAASGAPSGPEFRVNTYTTYHQFSASVATDSTGNFIIVWESEKQDDPIWYGVFAQRYASSGIPLGSEFRVNTYTTNAQISPSVAADGSGSFVIVWRSQGQDGAYSSSVFGQRYAGSGVPVGPEFRVNTTGGSGNHLYPSAAFDASGNFVVVWQSATLATKSWDVLGQRYSSSGAPIGPEFRVNTYTTEYQIRPSVAADPVGNFVVVWASTGSYPGTPADVLGQRFNQILPVELMQVGVE